MSRKSNGGNGGGAGDRVSLGFGNLHASPGDHIGHFYETKPEAFLEELRHRNSTALAP